MTSHCQEAKAPVGLLLLRRDEDITYSFSIPFAFDPTKCKCQESSFACTTQTVLVPFAQLCRELKLHPDHAITRCDNNEDVEIITPDHPDYADHYGLSCWEVTDDRLDYDGQSDPLLYHEAVSTFILVALHGNYHPEEGLFLRGTDFHSPESDEEKEDELVEQGERIVSDGEEEHDINVATRTPAEALEARALEDNDVHGSDVRTRPSPSKCPYEDETAYDAYKFLKYGCVFPARVRANPKLKRSFKQNAKRRYALLYRPDGSEQLLFLGGPESKQRQMKRSIPSAIRRKLRKSRIVPLARDIERIIREDHLQHHDGHNNAERRLGDKYKVNNLRSRVMAVCGFNCRICSQWNAPVKIGFTPILTCRPGQIVMFDLTKFPLEDDRGWQWILTVEDHFTKYLWAELFETKEAEPIARYLSKLFTQYGCVPERFHCDNGGEFKNHYMEALREQLGVGMDLENKLLPLSHGLPRNPRCQGLIERKNGTLKQSMLKDAAEQGYEDGDTVDVAKLLDGAVIRVNRQIYKPYGVSAYVMQFGCAPEAPDHERLTPADHERLYRWAAKQQENRAAKVSVQPIREFDLGDEVLVRILGTRKYGKRHGLSALAGFCARATIEKKSDSAGWYKLRWITKGLSGEASGKVSTRLYHFSRLRKAKYMPAAKRKDTGSQIKLPETVDTTFTPTATQEYSDKDKGSGPVKTVPELTSLYPKAKKNYGKRKEQMGPADCESGDEVPDGNAAPPSKRRSCDLIDYGGRRCSIDATWFNKDAKWVDQIALSSRKITFFVAYVVSTATERKRYVMSILGDNKVFDFTAAKLEECMQRFKDHGEPNAPFYRRANEQFAIVISDDDNETVPPRLSKVRASPAKQIYANWRTVLHASELPKIALSFGLRRRAVTVCSALVSCFDKLFEHTNAWPWANNSCHVDTWLMTQLASYYWLIKENDIDDKTLFFSEDATTKILLRTLLSAGAEDQVYWRENYWAAECTLYSMGQGRRGSGFHEFDSYIGHLEEHVTHMTKPAANYQRNVVSVCSRECTNSQVHPPQLISKSVCAIGVTSGWWSVPSEQDLRQLTDGSWEAGAAQLNKFDSFKDVLLNHIARNVRSATDNICRNDACFAQDRPYQYYFDTKMPASTTLPWFLTFVIPGLHDSVSPPPCETEIVLGSICYNLVCVVFSNGLHFNCNFCNSAGEWFHYDDCTSRRGNSYNIESIIDPQNPVEPFQYGETLFRPVAWHYVRIGENFKKPITSTLSEDGSFESKEYASSQGEDMSAIFLSDA